MEYINNITKTITGFPVKNLKWNQLDNIIVGMVKCPLLGDEKRMEGYIVCQWRKNGTPTNRFKGREDLKLEINY